MPSIDKLPPIPHGHYREFYPLEYGWEPGDIENNLITIYVSYKDIPFTISLAHPDVLNQPAYGHLTT